MSFKLFDKPDDKLDDVMPDIKDLNDESFNKYVFDCLVFVDGLVYTSSKKIISVNSDVLPMLDMKINCYYDIMNLLRGLNSSVCDIRKIPVILNDMIKMCDALSCSKTMISTTLITEKLMLLTDVISRQRDMYTTTG